MTCKFCPNKELAADDFGDLICVGCPFAYALFAVPAHIEAYGNEVWSFLTGNKIVFSSDKDATICTFDTEATALAEWNYLETYYWARGRARGRARWQQALDVARARARADIKAPILPCTIKASCGKEQIQKCGKHLERKHNLNKAQQQ